MTDSEETVKFEPPAWLKQSVQAHTDAGSTAPMDIVEVEETDPVDWRFPPDSMGGEEHFALWAAETGFVPGDPDPLPELEEEFPVEPVEHSLTVRQRANMWVFAAASCVFMVMVWVGTSHCLLYTSPSPRDKRQSRMPSSA